MGSTSHTSGSRRSKYGAGVSDTVDLLPKRVVDSVDSPACAEVTDPMIVTALAALRWVMLGLLLLDAFLLAVIFTNDGGPEGTVWFAVLIAPLLLVGMAVSYAVLTVVSKRGA
jgi:hypothetical protein